MFRDKVAVVRFLLPKEFLIPLPIVVAVVTAITDWGSRSRDNWARRGRTGVVVTAMVMFVLGRAFICVLVENGTALL